MSPASICLLGAIRGFLDRALDDALLDGGKRAARRLDAVEERARALFDAFVIASIAYEPPSGSTVLATPVSAAMICCVRSAMRAASSVGSASASSRPLQCSDCVPPSTAASA